MKFKYYILFIGVLLMASCNKIIEVDAPTFDVTTEATTFKVGEAIKFSFTGGNSHIISFYSGETRKEYDFREGRVIDVKDAGATMAFRSSVQVGTQTNQLTFLASTDFNGDYSSLAKVKAATWTDITSQFTWGIDGNFVASGSVDISGMMVSGKPIYFAFKYITKPQATNGLARNWFIESFSILSNSVLDNTISLYLANQANAGFRVVDQNKEKAPALTSITSSRVSLAGNAYLYPELEIFNPLNPVYDPKNPIYDPKSVLYVPTAIYKPFVAFDPLSIYNDPTSEHWIVSKAINSATVNLGPDWSAAIKGLSNPLMLDYTYKYNKAGTYKAVFVASNNSIDDVKTVVKEITFTITE